ncbi:MAG: hypothetical protein KBS52_01330 [Clostridiales bacterium]|nr:hypothetical protein [Candidatus Equinaster intestinalis]
MENKKYLPIKIVNMLFIIAALVMSAMAFVKADANYSAIAEIAHSLNIFTLVAGLIYLVYGYKKNAAIYYKIFMGFLMISQGVLIVELINGNTEPPIYTSIIYAIAFIATVILTTAKDFGKAMTASIITVLALCRIAILIINLFSTETFDNTAFCQLSLDIANLLLVGTAAIMIAGKYIDKAQRGSK